MTTRDWAGEIDRWTEIFRRVPDPPEPFATALREGWTPEARATLAADADAYHRRHLAYVEQLAASGMDLVRFDAKAGSCGACSRYVGSAYSLTGSDGLPEAPPLPICPACRHTLNLLTPFFLQSTGLDLADLAERAVPYAPPDAP